MAEPLYYVKGASIWKSPIETKNDDGSQSITLGFFVGEVSEWCDAKTVAKMLDESERIVPALRGALPAPDKLELLADWFDKHDAGLDLRDTEVQDDLRLWASNIRAALSLLDSGETVDG